MPRGSYGLQRIVSLANATTPGMLSAALWSKISALLGINTVTLPLRLTGSALSVDAANSGAAGTMSAADKAKLDAATSGTVGNALVQRDANGDIAARFVNAALNGNATTATSATSAGVAFGLFPFTGSWDGLAPGATGNIPHGLGAIPKVFQARFATQAEGISAARTHSVGLGSNAVANEVTILSADNSTINVHNGRADIVFISVYVLA